MSLSSGPLLAGGAKLVFSCLDGVVLATDQRSDTYTSGSGRTLVIDGTGGGSSSVNTKVVVSRDIWIKDADDLEHHVRIRKDIPVRVGQHLAFLYCHGKVPVPGRRDREGGGLMSVYIVSTGDLHTVLPAASLARGLVAPSFFLKLAFAPLWLLSGLVLLNGGLAIGVLGLAALALRAFVVRKKRNERRRAIRDGIEAEQRQLIQVVRSRPGEQAAIPRLRTQAVP